MKDAAHEVDMANNTRSSLNITFQDYDCSGMSLDEAPGRADSQMHLLVRLATLWQPRNSRGLAGEVAMHVWHLLDPQATLANPVDLPEVIVLGSVLMSDLKFIVSSFPLTFGTP